jgi:hypothetical protein
MANPTYSLIASIATTSSTVTFSSIPQTYTDLILRYSAAEIQGGGGYSQGGFQLTFNGDSTTNYSETRFAGGNGTVYTSRRSTVAYNQFMNYDGNNSTANTFGNGEIYIPNYTSTSTKQFFSFDVTEDGNSSNTQLVNTDAQLYRGTSAVTSITLTDTNGQSLASGTRLYLYGIKNS